MMELATDENGGDAIAQIPLGRLAEPREVSNLVLFWHQMNLHTLPVMSTLSMRDWVYSNHLLSIKIIV